MSMSRSISREIIERALEIAEIYDDEHSLQENYSGRSMYGATCFGITFEDDDALARFLAAAGMTGVYLENEGRGGFDVIRFVRSMRTDSQGHGVIAYWPGWTLEA